MKPLFHPRTKGQIDNFLMQPSHALGIVGEAGAGKDFAAEFIASSLLDCGLDKLAGYPYIKRLACTQDTVGIEQVREIQQFLTLTVPGSHLVKRILILENIEALSREAQNALLKTLEETPVDTVIIVTIARLDHVLSTIRSRVQQITLLPVTMQAMKEYFGELYSAADIERAFFISDGYVGLAAAIQAAENEHPLVKAINQARTVLKQSRYERMLGVDSLVKSKDTTSDVFLDGLFRLLHASYKQSVLKGQTKRELLRSLQRLRLVEQAVFDLENKVSQKLVLSRLLFNL